MKRLIAIFLLLALLTGCGQPDTPSATETIPESAWRETVPNSRFDRETVIRLTDGGMDVTGVNSMAVFLSHDIIYYEDREEYDSGRPYGEGEAWQRHSEAEADAHTVVNITAPGAYRVTGTLSAGQIRVDLGEDANDDPNAVVELILDNAHITCTVAPAILFRNVYECDGGWDPDTARPDVDTADAGANLILVGENTVSGSHVAKIFKDKKGEKKLWKQDGAIYSYMSMNISGSGSLDLTADNEGLGTELHLTILSGDIRIRSGNDGINTNEDGVSVTAIRGGNLTILAGLGDEGDGIDSNGFLVIYGGNVVSTANPRSDAGLDSDLGSYIHGGTVVALGSTMDWAESDSDQVTMNLQFAAYRGPTDTIAVTAEDGSPIFSWDPAEILGEDARPYQGAILSCPDFRQGDRYLVHAGGIQMAYTGTDVMTHGGPRNPGGPGPGRPEGDVPPGGFGGNAPDGEMPTMPQGQEPPDMPGGEPPQGMPGNGPAEAVFYMQDKVNFFSGLTEAQ